MSCDQSFSLSRLSASSLEHESNHSPNCISNTLKVATFSVYEVIFAVIFLGHVAAFVRDFARTSSWTPQKRGFLIMSLSALADVVKFALHLSGMNERGLYVVFFIPETLNPLCFFFFLRDWFKALELIHQPGMEKVDLVMTKFDISFGSLSFISFLGSFVLRTLGPMIAFENDTAVNWMIILSHEWLVIIIFFSFFFLLYFARLLKQAIAPAFEVKQSDSKLHNFITKLDRFCFFAKIFAPTFFFLLPLPLWMTLSSSPGNPGLSYFFYYDFFYSSFQKIFTHALLHWFLETRQNELRGSSDNHSNSNSNSNHNSSQNQVNTDARISRASLYKEGESKSQFPSIPMHELNPNLPPSDDF